MTKIHLQWALFYFAVLLTINVHAKSFEPLSWDKAYEKAEETLKKMTIPLLQISGLCQRQIFANNLLFQQHGNLKSGAPYYHVAGMYLYFDPSCDGKKDTRSRWILSDKAPLKHRHEDLDADGSCSHEPHVYSNAFEAPPLGHHKWRMLCSKDDHNTTKVKVILRKVPHGEKYSLLRGLGWAHPLGKFYDLQKWWYIGNTVAIPRLDIPSLNMQDAAGGFRTSFPEISGTVTVWPSLLAMGATWNADTVYKFAKALGTEFREKGANAILGPSVNVHRVARNGRNFEYMSGEDPVLGAPLAKAYVKGVQSEGVFAVVKHWVMNEQETNRGTESSIVDDKTAWELYYPPFQAAVDAGVCAAMCSYNKVNGKHSCADQKGLDDLHHRMGFKGFVQSDWWATHELSIVQGLDQEMPGTGSGDYLKHPEYFSPDALMKVNQSFVDLATKRILAVMYRMDLPKSTKCTPPHCKDFFTKDVTSQANRDLARAAAAESIILLRNEKSVLPISSKEVKTIAIIGAAADASSFDPLGEGQGNGDWATGDYYSGGGSGHLSGNIVTAYEGLGNRAKKAGIDVLSSLSDHTDGAQHVAAKSDVAIVVVGATSGESRDRESLRVDGGGDALIDAVSKVAKKTVVIIMAPGAVLTPWREKVDAIALMFLGGQETGDAWAEVIFGDRVPAGRLPIMLPDSEGDTIWPSPGAEVPYSEGLATSYRNPWFNAAYPFGHGLTYTTFKYGQPVNTTCSDCALRIKTSVENTGNVIAPAVVQVYLVFPPEAGHPGPMMKAFYKTDPLKPGQSLSLNIDLTDYDLSYWDPTTSNLARARGTFEVRVGESSADFRQTMIYCDGPCTTIPNNFFLVVCSGAIGLMVAGTAGYVATRSKKVAPGEDARPLVKANVA